MYNNWAGDPSEFEKVLDDEVYYCYGFHVLWFI